MEELWYLVIKDETIKWRKQWWNILIYENFDEVLTNAIIL
jgi:hypothetical protein